MHNVQLRAPHGRKAMRIIVASHWPCRLAFAAFISRSTSASVSSRVLNSKFGLRRGATVPITAPGDTSRRCALLRQFDSFALMTVPRSLLVGTVTNRIRSNFDSLFGARLNPCCSRVDVASYVLAGLRSLSERRSGHGPRPQNSVATRAQIMPRKFASSF